MRPPEVRPTAAMPLAAPRLDAAHFDGMFELGDDPWRFEGRWYEQRKRAVLAACLPQPRYARAFEPACAYGVLTAELAPRVEALVAWDLSARAVELARRRLEGQAHVAIAQGAVPGDWPEGDFDLIVLSEFGYYLGAGDLARVAERCRDTLRPGGAVVACHWRPRIDGCAWAGDAVNEALGQALAWPSLVAHHDQEFTLNVWAPPQPETPA